MYYLVPVKFIVVNIFIRWPLTCDIWEYDQWFPKLQQIYNYKYYKYNSIFGKSCYIMLSIVLCLYFLYVIYLYVYLFNLED